MAASQQGILANAGVMLSFVGRNLLGSSVTSAIGSLSRLNQAAQHTSATTQRALSGGAGGGLHLSRSDAVEKRYAFMEPLARFADPLVSIESGLGVAMGAFDWGKRAMEQAGQFQKAMELVQNMTQPASMSIAQYARVVGVEGAGATGKFTGLSAQLLKETQKFVYTAPQMAQAFYSIASSGYSAGDALKIVDLAAKGATIGGFSDMTTSTTALTGILKAYNVAMKDAASYSDKFLEAIAVGKAEPADFAASMASVLPVASAMGIKFGEVAAAIAQMTNLNFSADRATQLLGHFLQSITNLPAASKKYALSIGLDLRPEHVKKVGMLGIVEEIRRATGDDPTKVQQLFGRNTVSKMVYNALGSGGNLQSYRQDVLQVNNSGGMTERTFASAMTSVENRLGNLKARLSAGLVQLTTALSPILGHIADGLSVGLGRALPVLMNWVGQVKSLAHGAGAALGPLGGVLKSAFGQWPVVLAAAGHVMGAIFRDAVVLSGALVHLAVANPIVRALAAPFLSVKHVAAEVLTITVPLAHSFGALGGTLRSAGGLAAVAAGHATTLVIPLRAAHKEVGALTSSLRNVGVAIGVLAGPLVLAVGGSLALRGAVSLLRLAFDGLKVALLPLRLTLSGLALSLRVLATAAILPRAAFLALGLAQRRYTADQAGAIMATRSGALALRLMSVALAIQSATLAVVTAPLRLYKAANEQVALAVLWVRIGEAQKMAQQVRSNIVTGAGTLVTRAKAVALWLLAPAIGAVRLAETLATQAMIAYQVAGLRGVAQLALQKGLMIGAALVTKGLAAAQWILNFAMSANPLGALIIGVGLLVGAFVWAMHNTKLLGQAVGFLWDVFKWTPFGLVIQGLGLLNDKFHIVQNVLGALGGFFGLVGGIIKTAFGGALDWVTKKLHDFAGMFGRLFGKLMGLPGVKKLLGGTGKLLSAGLGLGDVSKADAASGFGSGQSRETISDALGFSAAQTDKLGAKLDALAKDNSPLAKALGALRHDQDTDQDARTLSADAHTVATLAQQGGLGNAAAFYKHLIENIPALQTAAGSGPATMNADDLGTQWLGLSSEKTKKLHAALAKAGAGGPLVAALKALDDDKNSGQNDDTIKKDLAAVVSASRGAGLGDPTAYLKGKYLQPGGGAGTGADAGAGSGRDLADALGLRWDKTNQNALNAAAASATDPLAKLYATFQTDLKSANNNVPGAADDVKRDARKLARYEVGHGLTTDYQSAYDRLTGQLAGSTTLPKGSTNPTAPTFDTAQELRLALGLGNAALSTAQLGTLDKDRRDPGDHLIAKLGEFKQGLAAAGEGLLTPARLMDLIRAVGREELAQHLPSSVKELVAYATRQGVTFAGVKQPHGPGTPTGNKIDALHAKMDTVEGTFGRDIKDMDATDAARDLRELVRLDTQLLVLQGHGAKQAAALAQAHVNKVYGPRLAKLQEEHPLLAHTGRAAPRATHVYGSYQPALPGHAAGFGNTEVTFAPLKTKEHDMLLALQAQNAQQAQQIKRQDRMIHLLEGLKGVGDAELAHLQQMNAAANRTPSVSPYSGARGRGHGPTHAV